MRLEHVGIAVTDIEVAIESFEALLAVAPYKKEIVPTEGVATHFFSAGEVKIELLESIDSESSIARFLEKRGPGLHHLAFSVDDLVVARQRLIRAGFNVIGDSDSNGADGKRIFFVHPKSTCGVLIECCENNPDSHVQTEQKLPGGDVLHRFGFQGETTTAVTVDTKSAQRSFRPLVLIVAPVDEAMLGQGIARRLEPIFRVQMIVVQTPSHLRAEDLSTYSENEPANVISIESGFELVYPMMKDGVLNADRWIQIAVSPRGRTKPRGTTMPKATILVSDDKSTAANDYESGVSAVLPNRSACPGQPEFDSLVPIIRTILRSNAD